MQYQQLSEKQYAVRLARGERLMEMVGKFCGEFNITGGYFAGIGAVDEAELAHYSVADKKYSSKVLRQPLEVTSVNGNVAMGPEGLIIHAHGTFGDEEMRGFGGHIVDMRVSGTLELFATVCDELKKVPDDETGLKLFTLACDL